ncbi:hypothetical protein LLG95_02550 [bacterium]|nr:hypothetical protein [bacterium]
MLCGIECSSPSVSEEQPGVRFFDYDYEHEHEHKHEPITLAGRGGVLIWD